MHAAVVAGPGGDVLRLWEWERTRDLVLQVDLSLLPGSDRLYASTRVINPDPEEKPLYYWTNIAVPESPGTRVLTTADAAWRTEYTGALIRVPVPHPDRADVDISHPMASRSPADYFYDLQGQRGRHIVSVEPDGAWLRPDVDARAAGPEAVPVGERSGRLAVAGVALRSGREVRRDPGGLVPDAARARPAGRWGERVVDRGVRWRRPGPGSGGGRICRGVRGRAGSRARGDGPRPPRGHPRALAHRGGRCRGRRAGEHRVRLGSCRAQAPGPSGGRTDPGPAVPTGRRRQPPGTPPARR